MKRAARLGAMAAACALAAPIDADAALRHRGPQTEPSPSLLAKPEPNFPVDVTFTLSSIGGKPLAGDPPSFSLDDKLRATGFSGCNTFSMALYPVRGQKLLAGSIALTRKHCGAATAMLERSFLVGLHSQPHWRMDGPDLVITGYGGPMRFRRGL